MGRKKYTPKKPRPVGTKRVKEKQLPKIRKEGKVVVNWWIG